MNARRKTKFEMAVIDRVRELRIKKNISQEKLAGLMDVHTSFISQVESRNTPVKYNLNNLNKIASVLGVSPQELIPENAIEEDDWTDE